MKFSLSFVNKKKTSNIKCWAIVLTWLKRFVDFLGQLDSNSRLIVVPLLATPLAEEFLWFFFRWGMQKYSKRAFSFNYLFFEAFLKHN